MERRGAFRVHGERMRRDACFLHDVIAVMRHFFVSYLMPANPKTARRPHLERSSSCHTEKSAHSYVAQSEMTFFRDMMPSCLSLLSFVHVLCGHTHPSFVFRLGS